MFNWHNINQWKRLIMALARLGQMERGLPDLGWKLLWWGVSRACCLWSLATCCHNCFYRVSLAWQRWQLLQEVLPSRGFTGLARLALVFPEGCDWRPDAVTPLEVWGIHATMLTLKEEGLQVHKNRRDVVLNLHQIQGLTKQRIPTR